MDWKTKLLQEAGVASTKLGQGALELGRKARKSEVLLASGRVARHAASAFPVRDLAVMCGRAGAAGAVVDAAMGGVNAARAMRRGEIDSSQAAKHVASEAGCGFVTSSAGTAGTLAAYMLTGAMGPVTLAAGMGASMGSRWVYRQIVGETLPEADKSKRRDEDDMEHIGPKPQS